jgi:divalent metal cation (Fe/Co/Zn/Cd) transporter
VKRVQLRWAGHRLQGAATIGVDDETSLLLAEQTMHEAGHRLRRALPKLDEMTLTPVPASTGPVSA